MELAGLIIFLRGTFGLQASTQQQDKAINA